MFIALKIQSNYKFKRMQKIIGLLEYSSLPGVAILINCKQSIVKLIWFLSIVFLLSFSIYFVLEITQNYFKNQEISSACTITETASEFPAVSLCVPISDTQLGSDILPTLNQPLLSCSFDGKSCNWNDFELVIKKILSKSQACYRFNSGKNATNQTVAIRKIESNDIDKGFIVEVELDKFWPNVSYNTRLIIYIQNASRVFFPFGKSNIGQSIRVAAGENQIRIEREFVEQIKDCVDNSKIFFHNSKYVQHFIQNNKSYSQNDCLDLCALLDACNCAEDVSQYFLCIQRQNYDCLFNKNSSLFINSIRPTKCYAECPLECKKINYRLSQSYLGHYFKENNSITHSRLKLTVFYTNLEYTLLTQVTKISWIDLVSSVGGVLGLFMGVSFFSLIEILTILSELFGEFLSDKINRRSQSDPKLTNIRSKQDLTNIPDSFHDSIKTETTYI